ncbi:MAG: AgmX/PglI C-terminal domain-containing protein [Polyangiaceae bacterium]|nr:AgmX/PglI C-terminal domain-containing protein [Polyangiaceae bacterium]
MRACATASAVFTGLLVAASVFAACTTLPPDATPPPESPGAAPASPNAAPAAADPGAAQASPGAAQGGPAAAPVPPKPKKAPETVADCKEMLTDIANDPPDGGVVMNNATTAADAGSSDRLQPILEVVKSKRDGFRCCFDLYARKNPGAQGRLAFTMKLKPDGALLEGHIKKDESDVTAPEIESCMVELAKGIAWPASPSGKETTYTHRFEFKPRR